jgi:hypothetical protein
MFLVYPMESVQQNSTSCYGSQHDQMVLMTMGTLSLCTDSAHPAGTTTQQAFANGLCITAGMKVLTSSNPKVLACPILSSQQLPLTNSPISSSCQAYMSLAPWPILTTTQQPPGSSLTDTSTSSCAAPLLHLLPPLIG